MNKVSKSRNGYLSVEHILVAAIVLIIGFFAFNAVRDSVLRLSENRLSMFNVDSGGYPSSLGVASADINPLSDFSFSYNATENGYIIVSYNNLSDKTVVIPKFYSDGKPIIEIGSYAFQGKSLTSIIIPNSIRVIGDNAFYNNPLVTSVMLPVGLKTIGVQAFANNGLTSISVPSSVESIDSYAFANNKLTAISLPQTKITYGLGPFNANKMTAQLAFIYDKNKDGSDNKERIISYAGSSNSVSIPTGVKVIDAYSFYNCQLTSLVVSSTVTEIDDYAFNANSLTSVTFNGPVPMVLGSSIFGANSGLISSTIKVPADQLTAYKVKAISNFGVAVSVFY